MSCVVTKVVIKLVGIVVELGANKDDELIHQHEPIVDDGEDAAYELEELSSQLHHDAMAEADAEGDQEGAVVAEHQRVLLHPLDLAEPIEQVEVGDAHHGREQRQSWAEYEHHHAIEHYLHKRCLALHRSQHGEDRQRVQADQRGAPNVEDEQRLDCGADDAHLRDRGNAQHKGLRLGVLEADQQA